MIAEKDKAQEAIRLISDLIMGASMSLAAEQRHPGSDVDRSDLDQRDCKQRIGELRSIRERLENAFSGAIFT